MNLRLLIITVCILYFFHLLFDFPLQGAYLAETKKYDNYSLWVHSAIWGIGLSMVLMILGLFTMWKMIMLIGGHYVIDYLKSRNMYKMKITEYGGETSIKKLSEKQALYVDQTLHCIQLLLCLL